MPPGSLCVQSQTRITVFPRLRHFKEFDSIGDAGNSHCWDSAHHHPACQERQKSWVLCFNAKTFIHDPHGVTDLREGMEGFSSRKRWKAEKRMSMKAES